MDNSEVWLHLASSANKNAGEDANDTDAEDAETE